MAIILFDDPVIRTNLLPFTFTRPVADIRIGILTIREKWERVLGQNTFSLTQKYLSPKFPFQADSDNLFINGALLPTPEIISEVKKLEQGQGLRQNKTLLAFRAGSEASTIESIQDVRPGKEIEVQGLVFMIKNTWDIFSRNGEALNADFELLTKGRKSQSLSGTVQVIGDRGKIFLEEGAKAECAVLNTNSGPVYLGKDSEIMEGCLVRGPFSLGEHSVLKMGAKVYGPTTIGPYSKAGGEVNNSVIFGYSNKAHDGFLGNSVIGEWCNLGADSNNSNLKNNYGTVKIYSHAAEGMVDTGLQFCGLMMGDHSKCAINTMFNTGTVVGVNANIFGFGFPSKFIPSFSWDGADELATYSLEQALQVAERVYERRGLRFAAADREILSAVFNQSARHRQWEKSR